MNPSLQSFWIEGGQRLEAVGVEEGVREALLMVTRLMGGDAGQVVLKANEPAPDEFDTEKFEEWLSRRCRREPLAYIFGEREFYGRPFKIGPGALVPRPDTEILVEAVLARHQERPFTQGLDLCSGPGTLGLSLNLEMKIPFRLVEISPEAMTWAKKNEKNLGVKDVTLELADVHEVEGIEGYDLIVCNPPYVEAEVMSELMPEVRDYEPALALDGGEGGLVFFYRLMQRLRKCLKPGAEIFVEVGAEHRQALDAHPPEGWTRHAWHKDLAGVDRVAHYLFFDEVHG